MTLGELMSAQEKTQEVVAEVVIERGRQDRRWGQQDHSMVYADGLFDHEYHRNAAEVWKTENAWRVEQAEKLGIDARKGIAFDGIVIEEVHEAFAEEDPLRAMVELIQAAATCVAAAEALERANPGTLRRAAQEAQS